MLEWQMKETNPTTVSYIYTYILRSVVRKYFIFMAFRFPIQEFFIP